MLTPWRYRWHDCQFVEDGQAARSFGRADSPATRPRSERTGRWMDRPGRGAVCPGNPLSRHDRPPSTVGQIPRPRTSTSPLPRKYLRSHARIVVQAARPSVGVCSRNTPFPFAPTIVSHPARALQLSGVTALVRRPEPAAAVVSVVELPLRAGLNEPRHRVRMGRCPSRPPERVACTWTCEPPRFPCKVGHWGVELLEVAHARPGIGSVRNGPFADDPLHLYFLPDADLRVARNSGPLGKSAWDQRGSTIRR